MVRLFAIAALLTTAALAQRFEVASVRPSSYQSNEGNGRESFQTSPDSLTVRNATLRAALSWAYRVQEFQVEGQSAALSDRFDIVAKAPGTASIAQLRAMLGALLQERFQFRFHRENQVQEAYALLVFKGKPKLRESKETGPGVFRPSKESMFAQHGDMWEFAGSLAGPLRMPVVDETGLTGRYDFMVDLLPYFPNSAKGAPLDLADIMKSALRDQLGLTIEPRKESIKMLVVDHVERLPSEN